MQGRCFQVGVKQVANFITFRHFVFRHVRTGLSGWGQIKLTISLFFDILSFDILDLDKKTSTPVTLDARLADLSGSEIQNWIGHKLKWKHFGKKNPKVLVTVSFRFKLR
jgi:hypothetical protein